jgi:hypothetical protein
MRSLALVGATFTCLLLATLRAPALPAQSGPGVCAGNSGGRELDFWLGEWSIAPPGATSGDAASTVSLDLDKCLIVESWRGGKSHSGKNIFGFSQEDKTWHGMFADNEGRVHLFEGKVAAGSADFRGSSRGRNGEAELHRITISRLSADKVEQIWEKSSDNGTTWAKVFDGVYTRRKQ